MEDEEERITRATINLVVSWIVLRTCSYGEELTVLEVNRL